MDNNKVTVEYNYIKDLLATKEIKVAINTLRKLSMVLPAENIITEQLDNCDTTYGYLVQYAIEGKSDPEREHILNNLIFTLYQLNDDCFEAIMRRDSGKIFYERQRIQHILENKSVASVLQEYKVAKGKIMLASETALNDHNETLEKEFENKTTQVFNRIWLFGFNNEEETIEKFFTENSTDQHLLAFMSSAMMLRQLIHFNEKEFLSIITLFESSKQDTYWRLLTAIIFVTYFHENRINKSPKIIQRLSFLKERPNIGRDMAILINNIIRTTETEQIEKILKEEILPEMMKINPRIEKKIRLNDLQDPSFLEKNPEWKEILSHSNIGDKMKELSEMQQEGADVMMSTFSSLKTFAFFFEPTNWFLPFNPSSSHIASIKDSENISSIKFLESLKKSGFMCNSDKYSFCFSILQMPPQYRNMVFGSFKSDSEAMEEMEEAEGSPLIPQKDEQIAKLYIQDLFRFFKLFNRKSDFENLFDASLYLHRSEILLSFIQENQDFKSIAAFYFKKNIYPQAIEMFKILEQKGLGNGELFQQMGYCYQMMNNFEEALKAYQHSELFDENNLWTIRRIAMCFRQLKNNETALAYLLKAETMKPNNLSITLQKGYCLIDLKRYEEAIQAFYKVDFMQPENGNAKRAIAWCCFLSGRYEEAQRLYLRITTENALLHDFINAGHVEWKLNGALAAIEKYQQGINLEKGNIDSFIDQFKQDIPDLKAAGIAENEIFFLMERLRYLAE